MKKSAILLAALLAGCSSAPPELLPPPFGPDGPGPARLFFPSSIASTPDGVLLVANGNFNHAFDSGTVVGISRAFLDSVFRLGLDCGIANRDARCVQDIPAAEFTGAVMIGNYAGPMTLDSTGTNAYTGSRDSGTLNAVRIDPGGVLHCAPGAGDDAKKDCRKGLIKLVSSGVDGPYSIVAANAVPPGAAAPQPVLFVSSIIPHIEAVNSGVIDTSTWVVALNMQDPSQVLFRIRVGLSPFVAGGSAPGPMVFDPVRRQLYLAGCYQRSASFGAGEPGTGICFGITTNYLRIVNVDSREAAADPQIIDLHGDVLSIYTTQLLLADPDPVTGAPTTLWATMRSPDSLVRIELPARPSIGPRVRQVIPLPVSPADMVRIDRGSASSLLAVTAEKLNAVAIVDTATNQVVTQVDRLGDSPFAIQEIPCPPENTASACLAAAVFGECGIALLEVPKAQPTQTKLRGIAGKCR